MDKQREVINMQDVHTIAAAVRAANARNVARCGRSLPIRKIVSALTGIAGFILAMGIEQNPWFTVPALALLVITLVLQGER